MKIDTECGAILSAELGSAGNLTIACLEVENDYILRGIATFREFSMIATEPW